VPSHFDIPVRNRKIKCFGDGIERYIDMAPIHLLLIITSASGTALSHCHRKSATHTKYHQMGLINLHPQGQRLDVRAVKILPSIAFANSNLLDAKTRLSRIYFAPGKMRMSSEFIG